MQRAWLEENVPQCGYCQAGQIMTTVVLLRKKPYPTDEDIDAALSANPRIRHADQTGELVANMTGSCSRRTTTRTR